METYRPEGRSRTRLFVSGAPPSALAEAGTGESEQGEWWTTPYGSWRLSAEVDAMRDRFPSFHLVTGDDGRLAWIGRLRSSLTGKRYPVTVAYPWTFPDEAPTVTIGGEQFPPGTPHLLDRARPCLYRSAEGPGHGYDPGRTTAATLLGWTALWIHAYETWRATDVWPGKAD